MKEIMKHIPPQKQSTPVWRNPEVYCKLGFALVAAPSILLFLVGMPYSTINSVASGTVAGATETVFEGAFQPFFLYFVIGAAFGTWGYRRNTLLGWAGSLFVLALSIITITSVGMFNLPGAVLLFIGMILRSRR